MTKMFCYNDAMKLDFLAQKRLYLATMAKPIPTAAEPFRYRFSCFVFTRDLTSQCENIFASVRLQHLEADVSRSYPTNYFPRWINKIVLLKTPPPQNDVVVIEVEEPEFGTELSVPAEILS